MIKKIRERIEERKRHLENIHPDWKNERGEVESEIAFLKGLKAECEGRIKGLVEMRKAGVCDPMEAMADKDWGDWLRGEDSL